MSSSGDSQELGRVRVYPQYTWPVYGPGVQGDGQRITVTDWRKQGREVAEREARRQVAEALGGQDAGGWWFGPVGKETFRWHPPKGTPRAVLPADADRVVPWRPEREVPQADLRRQLVEGEPSIADREEMIDPEVQRARYADRLEHQREEAGPGYAAHAAACGTCADLDRGGDGVGRRLRVVSPVGVSVDELYPVRFTFTGGGELGEVRHHAFEAAVEAVQTHVATWQIPDDLTGVLETDSFIASVGPFVGAVGDVLAEVAQKLGGGQTPVASVVAELLEEFAGSLLVMRDAGLEVHAEWQSNPENAHDLARARGEIPNAHLFNVDPASV